MALTSVVSRRDPDNEPPAAADAPPSAALAVADVELAVAEEAEDAVDAAKMVWLIRLHSI